MDFEQLFIVGEIAFAAGCFLQWAKGRLAKLEEEIRECKEQCPLKKKDPRPE